MHISFSSTTLTFVLCTGFEFWHPYTGYWLCTELATDENIVLRRLSEVITYFTAFTTSAWRTWTKEAFVGHSETRSITLTRIAPARGIVDYSILTQRTCIITNNTHMAPLINDIEWRRRHRNYWLFVVFYGERICAYLVSSKKSRLVKCDEPHRNCYLSWIKFKLSAFSRVVSFDTLKLTCWYWCFHFIVRYHHSRYPVVPLKHILVSSAIPNPSLEITRDNLRTGTVTYDIYCCSLT